MLLQINAKNIKRKEIHGSKVEFVIIHFSKYIFQKSSAVKICNKLEWNQIYKLNMVKYSQRHTQGLHETQDFHIHFWYT